MKFIDAAINAYCVDHTTPEPPLLQELETWTHAQEDMPQMLCGRLEGRLLKMLVQLSGAKNAVELGTFTGYSALSIAEGLPPDGKLVTCELDAERAVRTRSWLDRSPHGSKISIAVGPAVHSLRTLPGPFDFAFVDADKPNYPHYFRLLLDRMVSGGLMAFDNTLWSGEVLRADSPEATESTVAIHALNEAILAEDRVENVLLTVRDGIHLVRIR